MTYAEARQLDTPEKRWPKTEYVVEATHEEEFHVWHRVHPDVSWEQLHGWTTAIGEVEIRKRGKRKLERMPVCVCVMWVLIGGHLIAFYDACSQVVDHRMVRDYVDSLCAKHTNAANFHNCAHDLGIQLAELGSRT